MKMKMRTAILTIVLLMVGYAGVFGATPAEKSFCGIGMQLTVKNDSFMVVKIIPGGGAEKAGVPAGSYIVSIDGKPVKGMALQDVGNLLRGTEGTVVSLAVMQELGLTKTYAITRTQMKAIDADNLAGTYVHQDDPSVLVIIERVADNQFRIKCPKQHWSGMGLVGNDCFKGVFQMEDNQEVHENFRGAVSFFRIDFEFSERLLLRSRFNFFDSSDKMVEKTLLRKNDKTEPAHAGDGK
jgi:hypothetical protein